MSSSSPLPLSPSKAANKAAVAVISSIEIDTVIAGKAASAVKVGDAPKGSNQKVNK
jgi:hypothetical protein